MTTTIETITANNNETFTKGTYNGIAVIIRDKDGYINATKLGNNSRRARKYVNSDKFNEICDYWLKSSSAPKRADVETTAKYVLTGVQNELRGTYVHPDLIHFVAEWVDIKYAFTVADIMNSINDKVHEELKKQELPDTVENAKPIFNQCVQALVPDIKINNSSTWGYRDSPYTLDSWEQDDLRTAINDYKNIKERLIKAEEKINEWGSFVKKYHPDFDK